eukprot:s682_g15.t1
MHLFGVSFGTSHRWCRGTTMDGEMTGATEAASSGTQAESRDATATEPDLVQLTHQADAAVDPPEHVQGVLWDEVLWRMNWLASKAESLTRKPREKPKALALSDGWVLMYSKEVPGRKFYFNTKTGESSWKGP